LPNGFHSTPGRNGCDQLPLVTSASTETAFEAVWNDEVITMEVMD